jgi:two-component sensor histidine kinase
MKTSIAHYLTKYILILFLFASVAATAQTRSNQLLTPDVLLQVSSGFFTVVQDARVDLDSSLSITSKRYKLSRVHIITEDIDDNYNEQHSGWMDKDVPEVAQRQLFTLNGNEHARLLLALGAYYAFHPAFHNQFTNLGIKYLLQAKKENDELKRYDLSAHCAILLGKCYFKENNIPEGKRWFDTITNDSRLKTNKRLQAKAWNYEGMYCPFVAETMPFRITCLNNALKLYKQLNNKGNQINTLMDLSYLSFAGGRFAVARNAALQSLALQKSIQFPYTQFTYDLLAFYAQLSSDWPKVLEMAFAALNSAELNKDTLEIAHFYKRVSNGFTGLNNESEYLKWEKKALDAYERHGGDSEFWDLLISLAYHNKTEDGRDVLSLIKDTWRKHPPANTIEQEIAYMALGTCYQKQRNYTIAHSYFLLAEKLEPQNQKLRGGMKNHYLIYKLSQSYFNIHNYQKSRVYAQMVISRSKNDVPVDKGEYLQYYILMHQLDSATHNYKASMNYLHKYANLIDTISSKNESRQVIDINVKYETLQKEKRLQVLKTQHILELQKAAYAKKITYWTVAALLFTIMMVYSRYYFNKKSNRKLKIQKQEIDNQNSSLQSMNLKQQALLTEKELLLREIHHRVKNNLQTSMSLLNMQSAYIDNEVALETIRNSQRRMHTMSLIHQKLYQSEKLTSINMAIYIDELTIYLKESFIGHGNISFELLVESFELDIAQALPLGLIINEAVTNAIKYAFPDNCKGIIYIFLEKTPDKQYILTIKDNGIGLPNAFDIESNSSLGMNLMRGLSGQLQGDFNIRNNSGTQITITIGEADLIRDNDHAGKSGA